jgi:hypothetical protein
VGEIRRLLAAIGLLIAHPPRHVLAWSSWRRRRQAVARACHHRRRGALAPERPQPRATLRTGLMTSDNTEVLLEY